MSSSAAFPLLGTFLAMVLAFEAGGVEQARFEVGGLSLRKKTWTTDDDLPINGIRCLEQTRDGYLWLGTYYGLARFDGNRFRTFDRFTVPEMPSETITSLAEDTQGALWVGTTDGLLRYQRGKFRRYAEADGLPDVRVARLVA